MRKNLFTIVAAFCVAGGLMAAEFSWTVLGNLYRSGDYAGVESAAMSMKESAKTELQKGALVTNIAMARQRLGRYANSDAALADIDAVAKDFGLRTNADSVQKAKLSVLFARKEHSKAVEISSNWVGKQTLHRRAIALAALGRYDEASATYAASGDKGTLVLAAQTALRAKLPEKVFEYSNRAFASEDIKDPVAAITLVNAVIDADYTGTTVTPAKVKEFLQTVNRKYSRKLVVNAPTKWDTLIQLVRQTLETY